MVRNNLASSRETVEDGRKSSVLLKEEESVEKERFMKLGVIVPQKEIGLDAGALRAFAQGAEVLGYHHLVAFDSVFTENPYHEPLALFAFLAGCTKRIELVTGVIVAPSRQTLLLSKQATSVDVLSQGRLRLGIGGGWNQAEFLAMRAEFAQRGDQIEEQISVLRAVWTQTVVTIQGKWPYPGGGASAPVARPASDPDLAWRPRRSRLAACWPTGRWVDTGGDGPNRSSDIQHAQGTNYSSAGVC